MIIVATENGKEVLTMTEYIEREALMRRIKEIHCAECDSYHGARCRACWVDDTLDYIDSEPAADVEPVRHGRWIDKGEYAVCTECGRRSGIQYDGVESIPLMTQFCPNCGCLMDGGAD